MKKSLILLTVLLAAFSAFSAQYYVNAARPDNSGRGTSWGTAKRTIQAAVKLTKNGDTVLVTNGTYSLTAEISVTNAITIRSVNGPEATMVNGGGSNRCFNLSGGCLISGLTIINGVAWDANGGGVHCADTIPAVSNCVFRGNAAPAIIFYPGAGGGMFRGTAIDCVFDSNGAFQGGGMAEGRAQNCIFKNNYGIGGPQWGNCYGAGMSGGDAYNSLFVGNTGCFSGSGMYGGTAFNCTFVNNWTHFDGGALGNSTAYNCIFKGNEGEGRAELANSLVYNSCSAELTNGIDGNITNAPLFVDAANGDFRLMSNSPCINRGDNSVVSNATDLAVNTRIVDGTVDMGAYEYNTNTHRIVTVAGTKGTIKPVNPDVAQGYDQTFAIQPVAGYVIASLIIDGVPVKAASSYTFNRVQSAHTIAATYAVDSTKPSVAIKAPTAGLRVTNTVYTVRGTAADNKTVAGVLVQINGGAWTNAVTTNGWKNWSLPVTLAPGANTIRAYSRDVAQNNSLISTVVCSYVVYGNLTVRTNGQGTVTRAPAGVPEVGKPYTLTAAPKTGYGFKEWTDGEGAFVSTNKVLKFVMTSNRTYTANFTDIQKPVVAITAPTASLRIAGTSAGYTAKGTATDNKAVSKVLVQLNGGAWTNAVTTNGWKNWSLPVTLTPGTNTIRVYSVDTTGNSSSTSRVVCTYVEIFTLADYYPLPLGAEWLYDGTDEYGNPDKTRYRISSVNYAITCYTGRTSPRGYTTNCVLMSGAYLNRTTLVAYETWNDYLVRGNQYGNLGGDYEGDNLRVDRGWVAPLQMAVGEKASMTRDVYFNGWFAAPVTVGLQLIGKTSITVPAGTFTNVLHVRFTMTFPDGSKSVGDEWWAKAVGRIKCAGISSDDLSSCELIQYSLPAASSIAASGPAPSGDAQSVIADSIFDPQAAITVDGLAEDWVNVPRSSFNYAADGNPTATQEVAVALSGNNIALLLSGCPFDTNDNVLVWFKLRLTYGDGDNRHSVDLWTSGSALYGMIDGLAISGLEAVLSNGVLEVKFPVPGGRSPSQIILEEAGCGMDLGGGTLTELFRFPAAPSETLPCQQFPR